MINIILPMAGEGSRFVKAGYKIPKPFIDVHGEPMITKVLKNLSFPGVQFYLVARREHLDNEIQLVKKIESKFPVHFIPINKKTEGAACTVLYARQYVDNHLPLLIANSDQLVDIKINDFIKDCFLRKLDGSILTFTDKERNPKWSFAQVGDNYLVEKVREKEVISAHATVGIYLFSEGKYFVDSAVDMIVQNERVNNEFYVSPVYNYAIAAGKKIGIYNIETHLMHGLGTPEDLDRYIKLRGLGV